MDPRDGLLSLGQPETAFILDEVGITHPYRSLWIEQHQLRLGPMDHAVLQNPARKEGRIPPAPHLPAVVVIPEKVATIRGLEKFRAGARGLEGALAGSVCHHLWNRPCHAPIAADALRRCPGRQPGDHEERIPLQRHQVELLLDTPERGIADTLIAVWQKAERDFVRIAFGQQVIRFDHPSLAVLHEVAAQFCDREKDLPVVDFRLVDAPEMAHLAPPRVTAINRRRPDRNPVPLRGPRPTTVIRKAEDIPPVRIGTDAPVGIRQGHHLVAVEDVKDIDASRGGHQRRRPGGLRPLFRFDRRDLRPGFPLIGTDRRGDMLPGLSLKSLPGCQDAHPLPGRRHHHIGLIHIVQRRNAMPV